MSDFEILPTDPRTVVEPIAEAIMSSDQFWRFGYTEEEVEALRVMNTMLDTCKLLGNYTLDATAVIYLPAEAGIDNEGRDYTLGRIMQPVSFEGSLVGGTAVKRGRDDDKDIVRAVCYAFKHVEFEPFIPEGNSVALFERLQPEDRVYVPVPALEDIEQVE